MIGIRIRVLQFNGNEARAQEMADAALRFDGTEQERGTSKSPAAGGPAAGLIGALGLGSEVSALKA